MADGEKALIISHDSSIAAAERLLKDLPLDEIEHNYNYLEGFVVNDEYIHTLSKTRSERLYMLLRV